MTIDIIFIDSTYPYLNGDSTTQGHIILVAMHYNLKNYSKKTNPC